MTAPPIRHGRRLAAIMFADMVGYTALVQDDEVRAKRLRDRMRAVLDEVVPAHEGQVVQYYGDGALSLYGSAVRAVQCAIAVQQGLRLDPPVPVRIGIHLGDVVHDEEGAFGDGVNVAARIESMAVPGGVLISGKVRDELRNQSGIEVVPLGDFHLKNVRDPLPVYAVSNEGLAVPDSDALASTTRSDAKSIVVLPFVNMSPNVEDEYFSDGMSEELINLLTRINGLRVIARTSSFAFKGKNLDVRKIGRELGVRHVLEGSVRRAGKRVRITAQLIDARSGHHLFSEAYDRTLEDVFETQDELSRTIVDALEDKLVERPNTEPRLRSIAPDAYDEYLQGLFHWARWNPVDMQAAIAHFRRSIELDPSAAQPHAGIALACAYLGFLGQAAFEVTYDTARHHAIRAVGLDPRSGDAQVALALTTMYGTWDLTTSYTHFQKALSLGPGDARVRHLYAFHRLAAGDLDGAVRQMETAVALDPLSLVTLDGLGFMYAVAGRVEDGLRVLNRVLSTDPTFRSSLESRAWTRVAEGKLEDALVDFEAYHALLDDPLKGIAGLGYVNARLGRTEQANEILDRLQRRRERDPHVSLGIDFAMIYAALGDLERAKEHLLEAKQRHQTILMYLPHFPAWEKPMSDPAFAEWFEGLGVGFDRAVHRARGT